MVAILVDPRRMHSLQGIGGSSINQGGLALFYVSRFHKPR